MFKVFIDGGAAGNPGPAAIGVIIYDCKDNIVKEIKKSVGHKTNNEAEYLALIEALRFLKRFKEDDIIIYTDSQLLYGHMNNKYKVKEETLFPYFIKAHNYLIGFSNLKIESIDRGKNKKADALVKSIINVSSLNL